jgi:DNA-binding beta-propeller fold protein YncE
MALLLFALLAAPVAASAEQFLWQTNSEGANVHIFGLNDFRLVHRLEVGPEPHGIAAPDDGRVVYVSLEANGRDHGELLWINPRNFAIEHRLAVGLEPHAIATTPDGRWVYVPCRDGHYWIVDAEAKTVVNKIHTGGRPHNTQISRDGRYAYLSPMGEPHGVTVVDIRANHSVVGFIPFADSVRPPTLSADGRWLFQHVDDLNGFQAADTKTHKVVATVTHTTSLGWFEHCHGLALRPDQRELWSACGKNLTVHRVEPPAFPERAIVKLPSIGYWLTFSPDGRYGFVALSRENRVAVVDTAKKQVVRLLDAGSAPKRNLVLEY